MTKVDIPGTHRLDIAEKQSGPLRISLIKLTTIPDDDLCRALQFSTDPIIVELCGRLCHREKGHANKAK